MLRLGIFFQFCEVEKMEKNSQFEKKILIALTKQICLKHSQNNLPKKKKKVNCELCTQRYYLGNITKLHILNFVSSSISYSSDICDHNQQESRSNIEQRWGICVVSNLFPWLAICCYLTGHKQCKYQDFQRPRS